MSVGDVKMTTKNAALNSEIQPFTPVLPSVYSCACPVVLWAISANISIYFRL